jgi:TRAP-type mannitol/chloroaromatic compound transport system substrate-binding protein
VNKKAYEALPKDLQSIVSNATRVANQDMLAEYTSRNNTALGVLVNKHKVDLRRFPDDVLKTLHQLSDDVVSEVAAKDKMSQKVFDSFTSFRDQVIAWHDVSEKAYLEARAL